MNPVSPSFASVFARHARERLTAEASRKNSNAAEDRDSAEGRSDARDKRSQRSGREERA